MLVTQSFDMIMNEEKSSFSRMIFYIGRLERFDQIDGRYTVNKTFPDRMKIAKVVPILLFLFMSHIFLLTFITLSKDELQGRLHP